VKIVPVKPVKDSLGQVLSGYVMLVVVKSC